MITLTESEASSLAALLILVGRPHTSDEARAMESWVARLSSHPCWPRHDGDLLG